jgi:hypothetical protein
MPSSGALRCVAPVLIDVSEDRSSSIIRVIRIDELATQLAVTSNRRTLRSNTMYMLEFRYQTVDQKRDIQLGNRSFENTSQFKYLGTIVTNQNLFREEIKTRLNSGHACYHSVQNLLSSHLLSKSLKIGICKL